MSPLPSLGTPELLRSCPSTGAISELIPVTAKDKANWLSAAQALDLYSDMRPMLDSKTGRVALISTNPQTVFQEDGSFEEEFCMVAPRGTSRLPLARVYRLPQDSAPALLGRVLSEDQAYMLARQLSSKDPASLEEQVDHVLLGGGPVELGNDLSLRRSRVAGEYRLELTGASADQVERLKQLGAFTEIIAYQLRVFLPMGEAFPGNNESRWAAIAFEPQARGSECGRSRARKRESRDTGDDVARILRGGLAL